MSTEVSKTEVNQNAVKAFAFPTSKSIKAAKAKSPKEPKLKSYFGKTLNVGDAVEHTKSGNSGTVHSIADNKLLVRLDEKTIAETQATTDIGEWHPSEVAHQKKTKSKPDAKAVAALRSKFSLAIGDSVKHDISAEIGTIDDVRFAVGTKDVRIGVSWGASGVNGHSVLAPSLVSKYKTKAVKAKTEKPKKQIDATKALKASYKLAIGDRVTLEGTAPNTICKIRSVQWQTFGASTQEALRVEIEFPDREYTYVVPDELTKYEEPKIPFKLVPLFSAFVVKDRTFVKTGNSTAIAVHVQGTAAEPFAMLVTPTSKINSTAKRSFKQSDKVTAYMG